MAQNADLDCDVCGQYIDADNRYALTIMHGTVQEQLDFCSMSCLSRWTKQHAEEQRREAAQKLESSLSAEEETAEDDTQDLEEEIEEHFEDQQQPKTAAQPSYGPLPTAAYAEKNPYGEDPNYPTGQNVLAELEQSQSAIKLEVYDQPPIDPNPISRFIEESDPVEKAKREKQEQLEREKKNLQTDQQPER